VCLSSCLQTTFQEGILLAIEVQPGSHRDGLGQVNQWRSRLSISVRARPEKGMANKAVLQLLSQSLQRPPSTLSIVSGHTSRIKTVRFENIDEAGLLEALRAAVGEQ
jgi:uncharacterized protein (TIGR00251 family)